jgi:hypothetical protein
VGAAGSVCGLNVIGRRVLSRSPTAAPVARKVTPLTNERSVLPPPG